MSDAPVSALQDAANRVRDTAKWLLTTAGAVGAALLVGVQLTSLGKLDSGAKLIATGAVFVGLLGLAYAIQGISRLLLPRFFTLTTLVGAASNPARHFLDANPELLRGFGTITDLKSARETDVAGWKKAYDAWTIDAVNPEKVTALKVAEARAAVTGQVAESVSEWASLVYLRHQYRHAVKYRVVPGITAAAIAALIFVFIAAPKTDDATKGTAPARSLAGLTLNFAQLPSVDLSGADLRDTKLRSANLEKANLSKAQMGRADLTGANLRGADLAEANIEGVVWDQTTCPDGTISDQAKNTCAAHLGKPPSTP